MKYAVIREQHSHSMYVANSCMYEVSKFHDTLKEARDEAERLCRKERGAFMVLELKCTCYIEKIPVTWKQA